MQGGIQDFFAALGKWGCYALDIVKIAEQVTGKNLDPITSIEYGISRGYITYDWNDHSNQDNLTVVRPDLFLQLLTGKGWKVDKVYKREDTRGADYIVEVWKNAHFRLPDWDPLTNSQSVKTGTITSWRTFRRV